MTMLTVDDLARDLKVKNEDLLRELVTMGYEVEGPESPLETDDPAALRAHLINTLPQREVVEKRIRPTVIRRRVKPNESAAGGDREGLREEESGEFEEADVELAAGRPSLDQMSDQKAESPGLKKPFKKVRKPEPARILEMPPRPEPKADEIPIVEPEAITTVNQPQDALDAYAEERAVSSGSDPTEQEVRQKREVSGHKLHEKFEPARIIAEPAHRRPKAEHAPQSLKPSLAVTGSTERAGVKVHEPARIIAEAPKPDRVRPSEQPSSQGPSAGREHPVQRTETGQPLDDRRTGTADDRFPKKKKKKEKRMQPAQIIGKVELKREPPREPEAPEPPRVAPPAPAPHPHPQPRRVEVPPAKTPSGPAEVFTSEEDKRSKKKKDVKKVKSAVEEKVEEDKGLVKRRKEVVLRSDLYDDRNRPLRLRGRAKKPKPKKTEITTPKAIKRRIKVPALVTVASIAHKMSVKASEVIHHLLALGVTATMNEGLDFDTATLVATEFGYEAEPAEQSETHLLPAHIKDTKDNLVSRPPVVTVMGHVDHGKTSLLDSIRSTHVTDLEAGGITQHIGAYKVRTDRGELVFLDTPGHEAFTAMRARGAQVTDFVILVVAADDGVMDQTAEAINHARAANVPIIVAVNKIDKPEADRDRVLRELSEHSLIPESWGGDTLFSYVSAKTGQGVEDLLDLILLQAEMMELKSNPDKVATGTVIEARLDKGKGPVATVLVKEGTLKLGDAFVAGLQHGKVRAMLDHEGKTVEEAGPATPVEVQGFSGVPEAGEIFMVVEEEKVARQIVDHRSHKQREQEASAVAPVTLENLLARMSEQPSKDLNIILKADVQGSVEAVKEALTAIVSQEIKIKIIHSGVGAITESDVMLARASHAIIIGFNVRPTPKTSQLAEQEKIDLRLYSIIYEAIDDIRKAMEGMLAPIEKETINGRAEVRQMFHVPKVGNVAGCYIVSGKIERSNQVRLIRDNVVIYTGKITSMRRFKEDVREALEGYECGIALENYKDVKLGDIIEAFTIEHESAKLA
jgi:translation initiation factor IF-2